MCIRSKENGGVSDAEVANQADPRSLFLFRWLNGNNFGSALLALAHTEHNISSAINARDLMVENIIKLGEAFEREGLVEVHGNSQPHWHT